jgi:glycosyltransferase involved in cell wall biosynthesis
MGVALAARAIVAGVPIVAARAGELGDMLVDGQTALLTDPGKPRSIASAIWRLLSDRALGARLAENARRQFAAGFDAEAVARRLDGLYARAIAASTKAAKAQNAHYS